MSNFKDLSTPLMVGVSGRWLDPVQERPLLEASPPLAALLPQVERVHGELLSTQVVGVAGQQVLAELSLDSKAADVIHDLTARGIYWYLTGLALLVGPELAAEILALRDQLYPDGLALVNLSYLEEAGEIVLADARLTPRSRELLATLPLPQGTLQQAYARQQTAGRQLGHNEAQRAELQRAVADGQLGRRPADVVSARNNWIRTARALVSVAEVTLTDPVQLRRVVAPVEDAFSRMGTSASTTSAATTPASVVGESVVGVPTGGTEPDADPAG